MISRDVGQALQSVLPQAIQRRQGLNAIDELQEALGNPNSTTAQKQSALLKAYSLNPAIERSGLGAQILSQAQRVEGSKDHPTIKKPSVPGQPIEETPVSIQDLVPARPSMIKNAQGIPEFQLPFGPEEVAAVRQESRKRGYLPEVEERLVNDVKEFNQVAEQKRQYEIQNYQQAQQERRDVLENQQLFGKYLKDNVGELWENPDDRELSLKISDRIFNDPKMKNTSFADVASKVKQEMRPYQAAKEALQKSLERPLLGRTQDQKELTQRRARFMVEQGQKPQLQLMIAKGGNGEVEEAELLNPLSADLEKRLNGFKKLVEPNQFVKNIDPDSKEYNEQLNTGIEKRKNQENLLSDYLSREIKPGTFNDPGPNLLLIRKHLMDKGAEWQQAGQIIDSAISKGKIKLDPQQQIDFQKLGYPPLTGDTYSDTVLNNLIFPITGKQ